jgi:hypothetical protein
MRQCQNCKYGTFIREDSYICTNYYSFFFASMMSGKNLECSAPEYLSDMELEAKLQDEKAEHESPNQGHFEFEK